jgi:signal transduction histidine kinase/ActR/RegA family two-component response regulator
VSRLTLRRPADRPRRRHVPRLPRRDVREHPHLGVSAPSLSALAARKDTSTISATSQAYERERAALLTREQVSRMVAERANRAKDLFLATLSHELRTPLSAIVGWMRIPQFPGLRDTDLTEGLTVIDRNVKAQVQPINDILDVSRIVSGKLHLEFASCDLTEIVVAGVDAVRAAATARGITVNVQHDPEANPVECDAVRIQQVVWNLMSNAVKFTARGGRVDVALRRDPLTYRIQVRDNGQGISSELLPHIFDRFRQADSSSRRQYGGLGLGLSIVKHFVEQHGGSVEARSDGPGQGATFVVRLPFVAVQMDEYGTPTVGREPSAADVRSPTPLTTPSKPVRLDGLRVLVVDDEIDSLRLLVRVLERVGAVVTSACSAAEAMIRLSESEPEVLVSDLGMPGEDGIELIRKLRASGFYAKDLPAIALTAFAHTQEQDRSLSAGYQIHVVKPVGPDELTFVIAGLVDRIGESAP